MNKINVCICTLSEEESDLLESKGLYVYQLRSWDDECGMTIEKHVLINHIGTIVCDTPITNFDIPEESIILDGDKYIEQYCIESKDFSRKVVEDLKK